MLRNDGSFGPHNFPCQTSREDLERKTILVGKLQHELKELTAHSQKQLLDAQLAANAATSRRLARESAKKMGPSMSMSIPHNIHIGNRVPFSEQATESFSNQARTMQESNIATTRQSTATGSRGHLGCGALGGFYSSNSVSSLIHGR